jgi:spore maturation protein CgeB
MTVNFSRSSAGPVEQLKTRVIEATLAGTLLLTDDRDRARLFWRQGEEFASFRGPDDLPGVVTSLLAQPERVVAIAEAGQRRARELAPTSFWEGIDAGLARRRLPRLLGAALT